MFRRLIVAFAVLTFTTLASTGFLIALDAHAALAAQNRAAVVIDDGAGGVHAACVAFSSDTISGVKALELAGAAPVTYGFGSLGQAVCSLNGKGCSADPSCLTCGGADYWGYSQAQPNATGFTFSPVGAGATKVRDGGVEGWKWGKGAIPAFRSFAAVCDPPAPTTATAQTTPSPTPTVTPAVPPAASPAGPGAHATQASAQQTGQATPAQAQTGTPTTAAAAAGVAASATGDPTGTPTAEAHPGTETPAATSADGRTTPTSGPDEPQTRTLSAGASSAARHAPSAWLPFAGFGVVIAGLVAAGVFLWRRRASVGT